MERALPEDRVLEAAFHPARLDWRLVLTMLTFFEIMYNFLNFPPSVWNNRDLPDPWKMSETLVSDKQEVRDLGPRPKTFELFLLAPRCRLSVSTAGNALAHITLVFRPSGHGVFQTVFGDTGEGH